jgi:tRNA (guanine6-N2)-methyltransferase
MSTNFFSLTTPGLEQVSLREIAALRGVEVTQVSYRRIAASCEGDLSPLLSLRTVDDVFLDLGAWTGITRHRSVLARLHDISCGLDLQAAVATCAALRTVGQPPTFSVTVNFVGKRNYSTAEIKQVCAEGIMTNQRQRWCYAADDALADLNVRLFIEHENAFIGVRLAEKPLQQRHSKWIHLAGALKPPIAAAMLQLVEVRPGQKVLDPCCGTGTILVEATKYQAIARGGDADRAAVEVARMNTKTAGAAACIQHWDARALPLPDDYADRIVTNLPWGRQVKVDGELAAFYQEVCAELQRVLAPAGRIALLTNLPHLVQSDQWRCDNRLEISLSGQRPTILTFTAVK